MIKNVKKWNIGMSLLHGFMQHIPSSVDADDVRQFHDIVSILEDASGEDLSLFKIPSEKLEPRITSIRPAGYGGGKGSATYSKKKYCDDKYFYSQVHGLSNYSLILHTGSPAKPANPYESLTDDQLAELLVNHKIKPKRVPGRNPEYVYDRSYAIAVLLEHDKPQSPAAPTHSTIINMDRSNLNFHSPGAVITQTNEFKSDDFQKLIESIKQFSSTQDLSPENRQQINIDIGTVEVQIGSPRPSPSIIQECLVSMKNILENAAGAMLASGILLQIQSYLH